MNWITFAWQIEFITVGVLIYGLIIFLRAITNLEREFRIAMMMVLASLVINVSLGIMIGFFITTGIGKNDVTFWVIYPIIALVGSALVALGARKFFSAIEKSEK